MEEYKTITIDIAEEVATLILNRPDKLNSLDAAILHELAAALGKLNDDDGVKALILTGAGRAFCSGADLTSTTSGADKNLSGISRSEHIEPFVLFGRVIRRIDEFSKPLIAAVNGIASGAGLSLALAADIRFASENASFSAIFIKRGLAPDCGISYYLPRLAGISNALHILWTGDIIKADEAQRMGFVNYVVPPDRLMQSAREYALKLARGPSLSIEMIKRMVYTSLKNDSVHTQMGVESYMQQVCYESEDVVEGIKSFLEKRPPQFKGK
jgi:2-(1,2-epoxy-1,2-dihydrophenyl)acetyl-CoA isomerase